MTAPPQTKPVARPPEPIQWTIERYLHIADLGVFDHEGRVELIDGQIIRMSPKSNPHATGVRILGELFYGRLLGQYTLSPEQPVALPEVDSMPEPDFAILRFRPDRYAHVAPRSADVVLLVEVSLSSLEFDREKKGPLYAAAGVPEYWILNLVDRQLERYLLADDGSTYREPRVFAEADAFTHDIVGEVAVMELLPAALPPASGAGAAEDA